MTRFRAALPAVSILLLLVALLLWPGAAAEGVRGGLSACAGSLIPALFPFLLLARLVNATGLGDRLSAALARPLGRLFRAPGCVAAPFLLGLTGGYPIGAAALADLTREGRMNAEDAARLLPVCDNTGPGFLVGAVGLGVFGSLKIGLLLYLSHALAAFVLGLLSAIGQPRHDLDAPRSRPSLPFSKALTESVAGAVDASLKICGFVLCFSVLCALLRTAGLFDGAAGALSFHTGMELRAARALLTGLLELGGGVAALRGSSATPVNLCLAAFLPGFGSLSVHCQTLSVLAGTDIKASRLFAGRLVHGLISAGLMLGFQIILPRG